MPRGGRPLRFTIASKLRSDIIDGTYSEGDRIREEQVAEDFGVSRVPVREALHLLEQQRFVELRPRRGAVVLATSQDRVHELMAIRCELEVMAARLAAERRGGDRADELSQLVADAQTEVDEGRLDRVPELIDRFHEVIAVASGNRELVDMLRTIRRRVDWLFEVDIEERSPESWSDHAAILAAVLEGDDVLAATLMRSHIVRDEVLYDRLVPDAAG